jgi:hypothetical protein
VNRKNLQIVANGEAYVDKTNELLWEALRIESDSSGHVFFVSHHTGNVLGYQHGSVACAYNANRLEWLVEPITPDPMSLILLHTSFPKLFKQVIRKHQQRQQCVICFAMNADIILTPCGHVCLCKEDADKLATNMQLVKCPLCRQQVTSTNKVFLNR